jgi:type IV pilus assembly protein PilQ
MTNLIGKSANSRILIFFMTALVIILVGCGGKQAGAPGVQPAGDATGTRFITDITTADESDAVKITINSNRQLTYTSIKQNLPLGILFYFPDTALSQIIDSVYSPESDVIDSIETSQMTDDEKTSRIFITLKKDMPYEVTPEETGITVSFAKPLEISASSDATAASREADTQPEGAGPQSASRLQSVFVIKFEEKIKINVLADGAIKDYRSFTLSRPARIVFDMFNITSPHKKQRIVPVNTKWVSRIRHFGHKDKVRLVLETKDAYFKSFSAYPTPEGLVISVGKNHDEISPVTASTQSPVVRQDEPLSPAREPEKPIPAASTPETPPAVPSSKLAWVNRIDFRGGEAGKSAIVIGTTRFESAVDRITPIHTPSMKETTIVAIELREAVPHRIERKDDLLLIQFEASSVPPKPLEQANLPSWKKILAQTDTEPEVRQPEKSVAATSPEILEPVAPPKVAEAPAPKPAEAPPAAFEATQPVEIGTEGPPQADVTLIGRSRDRVYTGEKIALDFFETDIKNVFRILREISGKNFAIDEEVTGNVTMTLEKPVPWDQVLDLVLKMNKLGKSYEGDIIRIATLAKLTDEEKARQARIAAQQKSKQVEEALEPMVTEYISVNYSDAKSDILPHVKKLLSDKRGSISVDGRNNQLIVTDIVDRIAQIKAVVNRIDTVTPQVIIEARVVEISRTFNTQLGIVWDLTYNPKTFGSSTVDGKVAMNFPAGDTSSGFNFSLNRSSAILNAQLNAIETNNAGKVISAPKIVTLDGKKAVIKQGLEIPYTERDSSGIATVKFKPVDLTLDVTPIVTPDDRILMKINIEKNDVVGDVQPGAQPPLSTNSAKTELLVNDGDTIVIGGIIKSNIRDALSGWPGLHKIPLLGWLFKTESKSEDDNELLIFITPQIVQLEQRGIS